MILPMFPFGTLQQVFQVPIRIVPSLPSFFIRLGLRVPPTDCSRRNSGDPVTTCPTSCQPLTPAVPASRCQVSLIVPKVLIPTAGLLLLPRIITHLELHGYAVVLEADGLPESLASIVTH